MTKDLLSLPLISPLADDASSPSADWHGFTAVGLVAESAAAAPEPNARKASTARRPQRLCQQLPWGTPIRSVPWNCTAPAGGPDAAFAAFHYGADAVYLGLKKFSARAEAENFTLDECAEVTAYAHSLTPRRRVFVTINTVIRTDEMRELVEDVGALADIGVDAIILQDIGVYHVLRKHFPEIELHASTQLAVHNRAGGDALARLGFRRVVLAQLTIEEVRDVTATAGVETEVFIHGASVIRTAAYVSSLRRRTAAAATAANAPIPAVIPSR